LTENFQNPSALGTQNSLQLSLPAVSNAASLTESVCTFSRVSAPALSSAWLLPAGSDTSFQPLMSSAYLYQHSSTTMLSGVTGQSQLSTSAASYPGVFEWNITGSTERKSSSLGDFTVTVIDQDTAVSSMSMAAQYDKTSDINSKVPLYPSLSASLVQGTPSQIPNQGHSLSLPHQGGSQVYYYHQGTLGPLLSEELGPRLQSYGSVSYAGSRTSAQPEMVMVLKEIQPTNILPPASTSGVYYSVSAQPITDTGFQGEMENSLGSQPPSQTFCLSETSEFPRSCISRNIQILESNPPLELGDVSRIAPVQSASNLLALPPAPSQEQTENKNLDDMKTKFSKPLDDLLASIDPLSQEEQLVSENVNLGKNSLSFEDLGTLENGFESSSGFADIATLVEDIHLPQFFHSLKDLDQVQEKPNVIKAPSDQPRKNKHKASESVSDAPKAKIQPKDPECPFGGEVIICNAAVSDKAPVNTAKQPNSKTQNAATSRTNKTKSHGQEKTKRTRENKKAEENKPSGNKVKAEEKPSVPKMKRKKNQPDFSQENFKKPRSCLGMHMLESVQVFHALGKKSDQKTGLNSSRVLGNSSNPKDPQPSPAIKSWLNTPCEGKGPEKTPVKAQKPDDRLLVPPGVPVVFP
uniref:Chromosome 2 open reading frame 78 n=1 Tax=Bos indicus x Bos taurus TaxID=30522 RepID=A0A4W2FH15_BOBOX